MKTSAPESLCITGVTLLSGAGIGDQVTSVLIQDGAIAAFGKQAEQATADRVLQAEGCYLSPGFVDLYCNLREPGNGQKGNIASETRAAAKGGFTTVCAAPDSSPINDTGAVTRLIQEVASERSPIRVLPLGATTRGLEGELLSDMAGLTAAGCVAFSNGSLGIRDARVLRRAMAYARTFGYTLMFQPNNRALAADGFAHDGLVTARLGLLGIPEIAETTAVMELLLLAEETGVRLHLSQISTARAVEMVAEAQARGVAVSADVAMHQLVFTEDALSGFDSRFHVIPPLRSENDRQGLLTGLRTGTVSAVVSQHQPHDPAAKRAPLGETAPGLSSVESVLSMGLMLVSDGELTLPELIRALTSGPAGVLGLGVGELRIGVGADLCVFDPAATWVANDTSLQSTGKHGPILGRPLPGVVRYTISQGSVAWQPT
ncbi:dihydroorotase [Marinobacter salicampi]|uniref:dihydroorotase n=1 Tax=Marinobacter salicampi TaxID=435907 RepID=UPI00140D1173|nr:dihydroorotase [Marinobacter salicampi]